MKVDQYIFFPETCFASTIYEPEFTVCGVGTLQRKVKSIPKVDDPPSESILMLGQALEIHIEKHFVFQDMLL